MDPEALLQESECWLARRAIVRARERGLPLHAAPLEEDWVAAVRSVNDALGEVLRSSPAALPERAAALAHAEARRFAERGLSPAQLLAHLKSLRDAYLEVCEHCPAPHDPAASAAFRERILAFFDAAELAAAGWGGESERAAAAAAGSRRLALERDRLRALFASLPLGVVLVERDGFVSHANGPGAEVLEAAGGPRDGGRAPAWLLRRIAPVLAGASGRASFEEELPLAAGRRRLAGSAERMLDATHKFDGAVVTLEDVTERRLLEARLRAAERLASVGTLAAGVAHELASPLSGVLSGLAHLGRELEEAGPALGPERAGELCETAADARAAAARVARIVRAMQALSGGQAERLEPVLVGPALRRAAAALEGRLAPGRLALEVQDLPPVMGREELLEQVFHQLLDNAAQAVAGGGRVRVTAAARGPEVRVEVADDGPGIPADVKVRAFDPFFTTRGPGQGPGLGLAVARAVAVALGGGLALEDGPAGGTVASVTLRAADGTWDARPAPPARAAVA